MSKAIYKEWTPELSGFAKDDKLAQIRFLLRFAILAPSGHNMQPWRYHIDKDREMLVVKLDQTRLLPVSDPTDRISYLAVGGTTQTFVRAAQAYGLATTVTVVPDGKHAEVHISIDGPFPEEQKDSVDWIDAILRRISNRTTFKKDAIDPDVIAFLIDARIPGVDVKAYWSAADKEVIAMLTGKSSRMLINAKDFRQELANCIHNNEGGRKLGLPAMSLGVPALLAPFGTFLIRHANVGTVIARMSVTQLRAAPLIMGVVTKEDRASDWIKAGRAHLDVFLRATAKDLSFDTFAAATCDTKTRLELARGLKIDGYPQILFRTGKPAKGAPGRAPRLAIEDVLETDTTL